jgi:hypothetical protein
MADKIFDHKITSPPRKDALHPRVISPEAARGGPLGGRLLAMMVAAIILVVVASAIINFLS